MQRIFIIVVCLCLMNVSVLVSAQQKNSGGYSTGAYSELGNNDSFFDRLSDWFATVGKSGEEKAVIKSQRRAIRKIKDAQKMTEQKKKTILKAKKKFQKELKAKENQTD